MDHWVGADKSDMGGGGSLKVTASPLCCIQQAPHPTLPFLLLECCVPGCAHRCPHRPRLSCWAARLVLLFGPFPTHSCFYLFTDVGSVEGLAYHRGWDTLYWTSYTTSTITRHTVDQTRPGAFERETVITMSGDDHPRAFVLDECQK
jgi:hypothetical protein